MENQTDSQVSSKQDVARLLREHGILPTQQRLMIARVLFESRQHYSADQVMTSVNEGRDRVSKATVYNTLGLFARNGLVREVIVDPTRVFYDPNTSNHHHFYNVDTGELIDIDSTDLQINDLPKLPDGTVAEGVDVIIRLRSEEAVN
ncbi:MAG: transcriptional repressor [Gammaproteobacteria bacterium]|jgi:Fur family iron response transcriptional regulator|nr:transcriptional repressor [Gammaproteobacteria bacterium]